MTRPSWLTGTAASPPTTRRVVGTTIVKDPPPAVVEAKRKPEPPAPEPPLMASPPPASDPAARLRQALELLDGTDLGPLPAFAMAAHRRRRNRAAHALDQARTYLRRAVELVSRSVC